MAKIPLIPSLPISKISHTSLSNRYTMDQHEISNITGLDAELSLRIVFVKKEYFPITLIFNQIYFFESEFFKCTSFPKVLVNSKEEFLSNCELLGSTDLNFLSLNDFEKHEVIPTQDNITKTKFTVYDNNLETGHILLDKIFVKDIQSSIECGSFTSVKNILSILIDIEANRPLITNSSPGQMLFAKDSGKLYIQTSSHNTQSVIGSKVWIQNDSPTNGVSEGDLWVDKNNLLYTFKNTTIVYRHDIDLTTISETEFNQLSEQEKINYTSHLGEWILLTGGGSIPSKTLVGNGTLVDNDVQPIYLSDNLKFGKFDILALTDLTTQSDKMTIVLTGIDLGEDTL